MIYSSYKNKQLSQKVLERFAKDQGLKHIKMFDEPYFSYQIDLFDGLLSTKEKIQTLYDALDRFSNEQEFLEYYNKLKDAAIMDIRNNPAFERFSHDDFNKYAVQSEYCKHDIFNMGNIGGIFASIDLKKANFQALKFYDPSLIKNAETYDEYLSNYTDIPYIIKSKYIRQVIFGNLNTGRQTTIERFLTSKIVTELKEKINPEIKMFSDDEVVFEAGGLHTSGIEDFVKEIKRQYNLEVDLEVYRLTQLGNSKEYFVKHFINKNGVEFMNVRGIDMPQVVKFYYGLPLDNQMDLVFMYENRVAHFDKPLDFGQEVQNG